MQRVLVTVFALVALTAGAAVASADRDRGHGHGHNDGRGAAERLFTLVPEPDANPEGIAFDRRSKAFFVGITGDGDIYRGTLGSDTVAPFIKAAPEKSAIGLKIRRGKLYVAGGETGEITVYDLATEHVVATFETGDGGFLNDLVVTGRGDVFVTDSFRPTLWHVTAEQVRAGSGTPQGLDVTKTIPYTADAFNLNGIVAKGGRRLIVVNTSSGKLYRIDLSRDRSAIRAVDEIEGATVHGDGLLFDRGRLVVVQGDPAQLSFLKLRNGARRATLERTQTSENLRGPSTVDRAKGLYLVVNADFVLNRRPFTVAGLPRKAKHGR